MVCPVFGWVVFDMAGLSVICGWYGWFVADLWVWLVCGWFSLCLCACVCGGGRFEWSFSKYTCSSFLSKLYHFCFEAGTILRAFNARLGKVDTFLMFIKMREFQQNAGGFNMLLLFLNSMKNFH